MLAPQSIDAWRPFRLDRLAPRTRPHASLTVLDITKWFGDDTGGVRTYLLEKARYVEAHPDLRQIVIVPGPGRVMRDGDGSRWYRLWGPPIPGAAPYRFLLSPRAVARVVAHERPDVIEVGSEFLVPWLAHHAARRRGIPMVMFFHSNLARAICLEPARTPGVRRFAAGLLWAYLERVARLFETTIVASEFAARDLRHAGIERLSRVPLGVDLDVFHPRRRQRAALTRRALDLPDGPLALYAGRYSPEKRLDVLIDAWLDVERRRNVHLLLIGAGPLEQRLRARVRARNVIWRPFERDRERLADLLAAVDLYVSPGSTAETFGLASLEALASGTPVLAASPGAVPEQLQQSGAGATFRAGDAEDLATAALRLIDSDLVALGERGRRYAEKEHAWPAVFDRLFDVYRTVLARPPAAGAAR